MSDKTMVERMREDDCYACSAEIIAYVIGVEYKCCRDCDKCYKRYFGMLADSIDRVYIERRKALQLPLYEDDEPVQFGGKIDVDGNSETVQGFKFYKSGPSFISVVGRDHEKWVRVEEGERVKRPEPEVLDADGVPIKVGDTVWNINTGECRTVDEVGDSWFGSVGYAVKLNPLMYSHKQPDSLERIEEELEETFRRYFCPEDDFGPDAINGEKLQETVKDLLRRQREVLERGR